MEIINYEYNLDPKNIVCIIDSREKTPVNISPMQSIVGTLVTGDYSVVGLEDHISIERKSLLDLVACVGRERDRFTKEIKRLLAYPVRAVVVESTWEDIQYGIWPGKITPEMVSNSILSWICQGVPFILAGKESGSVISKLLYLSSRKRYREMYNFMKSTRSNT